MQWKNSFWRTFFWFFFSYIKSDFSALEKTESPFCQTLWPTSIFCVRSLQLKYEIGYGIMWNVCEWHVLCGRQSKQLTMSALSLLGILSNFLHFGWFDAFVPSGTHTHGSRIRIDVAVTAKRLIFTYIHPNWNGKSFKSTYPCDTIYIYQLRNVQSTGRHFRFTYFGASSKQWIIYLSIEYYLQKNCKKFFANFFFSFVLPSSNLLNVISVGVCLLFRNLWERQICCSVWAH